MKVSEERLRELVGASGLEPCDFEPIWDSLMVGEVVSMARELLALRKPLSEPDGTFTECKSMGYSHFVQTNGGEPLYRYRKP